MNSLGRKRVFERQTRSLHLGGREDGVAIWGVSGSQASLGDAEDGEMNRGVFLWCTGCRERRLMDPSLMKENQRRMMGGDQQKASSEVVTWM